MCNAKTTLELANYLKDFIADMIKTNDVLPAINRLDNANIESQIAEYNQLVITRDKLVSVSSDSNTMVQDYNSSIASMKGAIKSSLNNYIISLQNQISNLEQSERRTDSQLAPAHGSNAPIAPKSSMIYLVALILGLCIPAGYLTAREMMDTKVRIKKDLDGISAPFAGEIPRAFDNNEKKWWQFWKSVDNINKQNSVMIVEEGKRDYVNESFRVLRANIEFMLNNGEKGHTLILTSFNPGSGKIDNYQETVVKYNENEYLDVLPIGSIPPNPSELLYSPKFKEIIEHAKQTYDYIFLDCPPVNILADTQILNPYAERTLFIVRAGLMDLAQRSELIELISSKRLSNIALILNASKTGGASYGSRYGYRYGYGSHYGSAYGKGYYGSKKSDYYGSFADIDNNKN